MKGVLKGDEKMKTMKGDIERHFSAEALSVDSYNWLNNERDMTVLPILGMENSTPKSQQLTE